MTLQLRKDNIPRVGPGQAAWRFLQRALLRSQHRSSLGNASSNPNSSSSCVVKARGDSCAGHEPTSAPKMYGSFLSQLGFTGLLLHSCTTLHRRRICPQQHQGPVSPEMKAADRVTNRGKMAVQAKTPLVPHACMIMQREKYSAHAASQSCLGSATLRTNCYTCAQHAQQASSEGSWSAVATQSLCSCLRQILASTVALPVPATR